MSPVPRNLSLIPILPPFPKERFLEAVDKVVSANAAWVPPYGSGATLYLRPYMFASGPVIGVKPSDEYQFRLFGTPVGPYFKGGAKPITICVSDFDPVSYTHLDVYKRQGYSLENQEKLVRDYIADQQDMRLYRLYIDNGATGTVFELSLIHF